MPGQLDCQGATSRLITSLLGLAAHLWCDLKSNNLVAEHVIFLGPETAEGGLGSDHIRVSPGNVWVLEA